MECRHICQKKATIDSLIELVETLKRSEEKMELIKRPRRLRGSANLRKMVRETRMDKSSLIYPLFVMEGNGIQEEIPSMEGQYRYSLDRLPYKLEQLEKAGVNSIMLFGIPAHKG